MSIKRGEKIQLPRMVDTPAVAVDLDRLQANIRDMALFARDAGVALRPHVKAHKIKEIARQQKEAGAVGVTVAKLGEAEVMVEAGITDILIAYQVIGEVKLRRLADLVRRAKVTVAVDSIAGARELSMLAQTVGQSLQVVIEVDTGLKRCGVLPGEETLALARQLLGMAGLQFAGIMTHAGHVYGAASSAEVAAIGQQEGELMVAAANLLRSQGIGVEVVSVGSTPTAKIAGLVPGVTEIRPGNYVFYDAIQHGLGVVALERCALSIWTTVISKPAPGRLVVDAGSKTFALDRGAHGNAVVQGHGVIKGYPGLTLTRLSEEHGIIEGEPLVTALVEVGQQLEVIPNHACPVINLTDQVLVTKREEVVGVWPVDARGQVR
ncbi:MAG: alanine racemase [Bacillota bacterium]